MNTTTLKEANTMKHDNTITAIIEYFENNEETFNACIEELDSYNGYLGDDRYYYMEYLKDLYCDVDPIEILNLAFYGYDSETWHTDSHGEKEYGSFNPNREYFTYNGYGNLVSADYKDYSGKLDKYAIEAMIENRQYINSIDEDEELKELFDKAETEDENEEEA